MRRSIKSTLVSMLGAAVGFVSSATATDYYVSPSGSDTNDGKTPKTAWSIEKVARTNFQPGDIISLDDKQVFSDTMRIQCSGTATSPVIFMDGKIVAKGREKVGIYLKNCSNVQLKNIKVQSSEDGGILLSQIGDGCKNISFNNIEVFNCNQYGFKGANPNDTNITLENCTFENISDSIIDFRGKSITLKNNRIRGNGIRPAIGLYGVQKAVIEGNEISTLVAPKPIFLEMKPRIPELITDRNTWKVPRTHYEGFIVDGKYMSLSDMARYTNNFKTDNKPGLMNPTPQLPQVQPQGYQTNTPTIPLTPLQKALQNLRQRQGR